MQRELMRIVFVSATMLGASPAIAASTTAPVSREITPPKDVPIKAPDNAVVIRPGTNSAVIQSLTVKRQITLSSVRSSPVITLRSSTVDFKPVLANPRALFNVAQALRAKPQLANVRTDDTQIYEVEQGIIIRSVLSYEIKAGVCSNTAKRGQLAGSGVQCAARLDSAKRTTAFANPSDPHYVADPVARMKAIADASANAAEVGAAIDTDITDLRARFSNAAQKAELVTQLGAAEVTRLQTLDDDALKAEMVNSGEVVIEDVMFIPAADRLDVSRSGSGSSKKKPPVNDEKQLQTAIFLTGFTLGRNYEWRQRIEKSIKWCVLGCKKTYFAEVFAGFNYGFGLRFPIKLDGSYKHNDNGTATSASVTVNYAPFDGSAADYAAAGLPADQIFDGKELVAQFGAHAGFGYKIPFYPSLSIDAKVGIDFTDDLPAPFTDGQFTPPAPGGSGLPPLVKNFPDVDLIAGRANFGVVGAKVFPAVKAELQSSGLTFRLQDNVKGVGTDITGTGQQIELGIDPEDESSDFAIKDPVYDLNFLVTPGLTGRIFIDVSVWSNNWDWPVWFPQLAVKLPPGGLKFACHEGTVCSRNYHYSPTVSDESAGAKAVANTPFNQYLAQRSAVFEAQWPPQCLDKKCKTEIKQVRGQAEINARDNYEDQPFLLKDSMIQSSVQLAFNEADAYAAQRVQASKERKIEKGAMGWLLIYKAVWIPKCADDLCKANVTALLDKMPAAAVEKQKQFPDEDGLHVQTKVAQDFAPKLQKEVDDSKARINARRTPDEPPSRKP
jgi:hypothetical protein